MSNLSSKYTNLKKMVGGNREKLHYEETFGMSIEELQYITPPNKWIRRILSEIEFAIRLSSVNDNKFDEIIDHAIDYLQKAMDEDGVLTKANCFAAEELLMPCKDAAKEYRLILAGHAHIDMNWMWGWQETVAATLSTFRTVLHLMDEYPDFCFSQSQASVYKIVEDYDPAMMDEIKKRIREGRWEITAAAWVETDKNMPNTESLLRHIQYTREYLKEHWDINPDSLEVDFSPDTFGHSANIPEIDQFGNVKYYYHCRGLDGDNALYRWKGQSGKEVLVYREQYWYNSAITPLAGIGIIDISKRCGGLKTGLIVYGVGNHGGGPTRRDVERAIEMNEWPIFPVMQFGTFREFFQIAESVKDKLPLVQHELNYILTGCYTTQSRIKLGNRHAEAALYNAEGWSALSSHTVKAPYMKNQLKEAWQNVLFTHFHDILTGSCVQESREHAMGLFANAMAVTNTQTSNALRNISEHIDTSSIIIDKDIESSQSEGAGVGYGIENYAGVPSPERGAGKTRIFQVFNSSGHTRTQLVEITVWDWVGDMRRIQVEDTQGNELPFQLVDSELKCYWDHRYFRILVNASVPAFGYTTLVLKESEPKEYTIYYQPEQRTHHAVSNFILENRFIRAEFDFKTGALISFIDKESGKEQIRFGECGSLVYIETEADTSSAWVIGRYNNLEKVSSTRRIHDLPHSSKDGIRQGFEMEQVIKNSVIKTVVTLDQDAKALTYHFEVDWHEVSRNHSPVPVLVYTLPLQAEVKEYLRDIPAGALYRSGEHMEVAGLQYAAAVVEDRLIALVTDCKYGYRCADQNLTCTLINSSTSPDPYPERGIHKITLSVAVAPNCPKTMKELASDLNQPLCYQPSGSHKGILPSESSLLQFDSETAVLSAVLQANDGSLLVRCYETCGKQSSVTITLNQNVAFAEMVDLMENPVNKKVTISDHCVTFEIESHTIQAVKIQ